MEILAQPRLHRNMTELQWICRDIAAMLDRDHFQEALIHLKNRLCAKQLKSMLVREEGEALETHRKRKIPYDRPLDIPIILRLPTARHRQLGVKWAFGRFPPFSTTLLEEKFGDIVGKHLRELHMLLSKYSLHESEMRATEASLDQLLFFHKLCTSKTWNRMSGG